MSLKSGSLPSESSSSGQAQPDPESVTPNNKTHLKIGIDALKQGAFDEALASLRQVSQGKYYERAQQALVVTHDKIGDFEKAIALCYPLASSQSPEIQAWAQKSLDKLKRRARRKQEETAEAPTIVSEQPIFPVSQSSPDSMPELDKPEPETLPATHNQAEPSNATPSAARPPLKPSTLSKRNPRWRPVGVVPTWWLSWVILAVLGLFPLRRMARAAFWPRWISDYSLWAVVVLGVLVYGLVLLNRRRLDRIIAPVNLRVEELLTVLGFMWWLPFSLTWIVRTLNRGVLARIPWLHPQIPDWTPLKEPLTMAALLLAVVLPWGMRLLLRSESPSLPLTDLASYSPDAVALMRRFFRQQRRMEPPPMLLLKTDAPLIFSVAHVPRDARIFVSQGLLDRLDSEAIAALVGAELAHLENHSSLVLPWLTGLLQLPYGLYRGFAALGNVCAGMLQNKQLDVGFKLLARLGLIGGGLLAAIAYGLFKLWRWPLLWLSRSRTYHGDRATADFLGETHAHSRALQAYAQALVAATQAQAETATVLESFELLLPLGLPVALTLTMADGSVAPMERLTWDCVSPYRHWLNLNNAHPLLGDRLARLNQYSQRSQVPPALPLPPPEQGSLNPLRALFEHRTSTARRQALRDCFGLWKPLLLQGAPFYGIAAGVLAGLLMWMLGATASFLGLWQVDWMLGDRHLIWGAIPLGIGLGLILRTNSFFPQKSLREQSPAQAASLLLMDTHRLPLAAEPVQFTGKLVGRSTVKNWLGQDLLLQTEAGLLRLHWCSPLGPAGNLWPTFLRPSLLIEREVVVSGWLRRGATLWLDVEQLQTTSGGRSSQRGHPMWAAVMAAIAVLWGSLILLRMA